VDAQEPKFHFAAHTLETSSQGPAIASVLNAALEAVDPGRAVHQYLQFTGELLLFGETGYDLSRIGKIWVVGIGKACQAMARAAVEILGERIEGGTVIAKHAAAGEMIGPIEVLEGSHPLPTQKSVIAAGRLSGSLAGLGENDLVICLISGGGSALAVLPDVGIRLEDLAELNRQLLASGANIGEINLLRKHLDRIKGGGISRMAAPAHVIGLVLSDVVGSPLDTIASGPTAPDPGTYAAAWEVVERYQLGSHLPATIRQALQDGLAGKRPETPKPGDPLFNHTHNLIVGSNLQAAQAALAQAHRLGYHTLLLTTYLQGEARLVGETLAAVARQLCATGDPLPLPACIAVGGETTVTLRGSGRGGRNQELALGAVAGMKDLSGALLVTLATDGEDGPTDASGAVVSGESLSRAQHTGLDPAQFLANNDAYAFFDPLGDLLRPGPTGTNVNDLAFLFVA
jgi:hydroxypyruvate reductase